MIEIKTNKQWFSIAAKHNGKIIGNLLMIIKEDSKLPYGWVDDLFVAKDWRGHGIAKNLILRAYKELIALGIQESRLEVWSDNKKALSLYEKLGYRFYEQTENSIGIYI